MFMYENKMFLYKFSEINILYDNRLFLCNVIILSEILNNSVIEIFNCIKAMKIYVCRQPEKSFIGRFTGPIKFVGIPLRGYIIIYIYNCSVYYVIYALYIPHYKYIYNLVCNRIAPVDSTFVKKTIFHY